MILLLLGCPGGGFLTSFDTAGGSSTGGSSLGMCLPTEVAEVLSAQVRGLQSVAKTQTAPPDAAQVTMFFEAPGLSAGAWYTLNLAAACPDPAAAVAPFCAGGVCYAPACVEGAPRWVNSVTPDPKAATGKWTFTNTTQTIGFTDDGTALAVSLAVSASSATGWSIAGAASGTLGGTLEWNADYAVSGSHFEDLRLELSGDTGTAYVWGAPVAVWDGSNWVSQDCVEAE